MHVIDLFDGGARKWPQRMAFTAAGGDFTYAEAQRLTYRIARALHRDGFSTATRFAAYAPNCGEALIAILGGLRAGGAWCNINLRNTLAANADILGRGGCEVL